MFLIRTFSIPLPGLLFYLLAFQASAELTCFEDPLANLMQVAYLEDDGYRPLSADEEGAPEEGDFAPKSDASSEHWRPEQQSNDCKQSSLTQSEDRGYRPLNYRGSKQQSSSHDHRQSYMPEWGGTGYRGNYPSYGVPAYPGGESNIWTQGGNPYFTAPPMIPGYGVMPYSFGGGGLRP